MNEDYNYFQDEEFRASLAAYEQMQQTGESADAELDSETLTDIAEYYAMNQRMDEANRCIQYALSFYPDSVDPQIFLSRQQMFYGNKEKAWSICKAIPDQEDREVVFLQAELHFYFTEPQGAFDLLSKHYAELTDNEAAEFLFDSIALCMDYGFSEKALAWVLQLRHDYPDYTQALALQAEVHNQRHEYQQAVDLLMPNLPLLAFDTQAWLQLAEAQLWLDKYDDALEATDYLLAISADNAEGLMMRANILLDMGKLDEAHNYYTRFLTFFPNDEKANYLDARCLVEQENYQMAIQRLELLASRPGSTITGYVYSHLAYCYAQLGHSEQSLHYRQKAEREDYNCLAELFPDSYPDATPPNFDDLPF